MNYGYGMIKSIKFYKDFKHITMSLESVVESINLKKFITKTLNIISVFRFFLF